MNRILEELHREIKSDPVATLEAMMAELLWKGRLLTAGAVDPKAFVRVPRNPHFLVPETIEIQLRWHRRVGRDKLLLYGANMPPFMDSEVMLLSRAALKERLEAWFCEVVRRV